MQRIHQAKQDHWLLMLDIVIGGARVKKVAIIKIIEIILPRVVSTLLVMNRKY